MDDKQDAPCGECLTRAEKALCLVGILAGAVIAGMALDLLLQNWRILRHTDEAITQAQRAASERLGG